MFPRTSISLILLSLFAGCSIALAAPKVVFNSSPLNKIPQVVTLEELWRVGEDEDLFFGQITTTVSDEFGQLYVLDGKQNQVQVFDTKGNHLRTLSREGDGPGEIRNASDIFITHDEKLAISSSYPGGLVFLQLDGTPAGKKRVTPQGVGENIICFLDNAVSLNGTKNGDMIFVWGGQYTVDGRREQRRFLSCFSKEMQEINRYHETSHIRDRSLAAKEVDDYFPEDNLHCIGPDGRLYFASERNNYRIQVYSSSWQQLLTIEREFKSRKRNSSEFAYFQGLYSPGSGSSHGPGLPAEVSEITPDIEALHIGTDGNLWVQHSRSYLDQPAGIMLTYDVFGPDGRWLHQKSVACAGNGHRDRLVPLADGRWLRLVGAVVGYSPPEGGGEEEDDLMEIICYTGSQGISPLK